MYFLAREGLLRLENLQSCVKLIDHLSHRFKLNPKLPCFLIKLSKYLLTCLYELEKDKHEISLQYEIGAFNSKKPRYPVSL